MASSVRMDNIGSMIVRLTWIYSDGTQESEDDYEVNMITTVDELRKLIRDRHGFSSTLIYGSDNVTEDFSLFVECGNGKFKPLNTRTAYLDSYLTGREMGFDVGTRWSVKPVPSSASNDNSTYLALQALAHFDYHSLVIMPQDSKVGVALDLCGSKDAIRYSPGIFIPVRSPLKFCIIASENLVKATNTEAKKKNVPGLFRYLHYIGERTRLHHKRFTLLKCVDDNWNVLKESNELEMKYLILSGNSIVMEPMNQLKPGRYVIRFHGGKGQTEFRLGIGPPPTIESKSPDIIKTVDQMHINKLQREICYDPQLVGLKEDEESDNDIKFSSFHLNDEVANIIRDQEVHDWMKRVLKPSKLDELKKHRLVIGEDGKFIRVCIFYKDEYAAAYGSCASIYGTQEFIDGTQYSNRREKKLLYTVANMTRLKLFCFVNNLKGFISQIYLARKDLLLMLLSNVYADIRPQQQQQQQQPKRTIKRISDID